MLFHKYGGANTSVTNWMSHFPMFVPTKDTVKLANESTGHAQGIGIILCCFPNCAVIYPVGTVQYFPGHPSNNILSDALKLYVFFKVRLHLNFLNIMILLTLKVILGYHNNRLKIVLTVFKL